MSAASGNRRERARGHRDWPRLRLRLESGGEDWLSTPGLGKRTWGGAARGGTCAAPRYSVLAKNIRCLALAKSSRGRGGGTREERLLELHFSGREFAALRPDFPDSRETRGKLRTGLSLSPLWNADHLLFKKYGEPILCLALFQASGITTRFLLLWSSPSSVGEGKRGENKEANEQDTLIVSKMP